MVRFIFPITFCTFLLLMSFRIQADKAPGYGTVDTLTFYSVSTSAISDKDGNRVYKVNDEVVDKSTYDKYKSGYNNLANCKPCWLRTYSRDGKLLREGMQYSDCVVGDWKAYHTNGKLKAEGHYLENHTGKWNNLYKRGYCSTKDGVWKYYDVSGKDSLTETYAKGLLVK